LVAWWRGKGAPPPNYINPMEEESTKDNFHEPFLYGLS
jgi:hypothetical protein